MASPESRAPSTEASDSTPQVGRSGEAYIPLVHTTDMVAIGPRGPIDAPALTGLGHASSGQRCLGEVVGVAPHEGLGPSLPVVEVPSVHTMAVCGIPGLYDPALQRALLTQQAPKRLVVMTMDAVEGHRVD